MILLFEFDFQSIRLLDVLDVLIVAYLIFKLYQLLRGSLAFNIFIGILLLYVFWRLVDLLEMKLLSSLLGPFLSLGVITLLIVFQPEVRRFLLLLGNTTLKRRGIFQLLAKNRKESPEAKQERLLDIKSIKTAILNLARNKTGALIVLANDIPPTFISDSGVVLEAKISQPLLESIFNRESPLHDGAVVIGKHRIYAASCILPLSTESGLPKSMGLRHRAGIGVTEKSAVTCFIVSEESGEISVAAGGKLKRNLDEGTLSKLLLKKYA